MERKPWVLERFDGMEILKEYFKEVRMSYG
jgi:hypothetical protein